MPKVIAGSPHLPEYNENPVGHVNAVYKYFGRGKKILLVVDLTNQEMHHYRGTKLIKTYKISSSKYGIGSKAGTNKTPLGVHFVATKFGRGARKGTIFKARINTRRVAKIITDESPSKADYVTSRILWLKGLQRGINRGRGIDSYKRYIYIHGTAEEGRIGKPASHGCIRMYNDDVIELFKRVPLRSLVSIIR